MATVTDALGRPALVDRERGRWRVRVRSAIWDDQYVHVVDRLEDVAELLGVPAGEWALQLEREPATTRLPVAPLVAEVGSVAALALRIGVDRRLVYRAMHRGVSVWKADRWACALGLHPCEVWGDLWWGAAVESPRSELADEVLELREGGRDGSDFPASPCDV